ncbi:MAG: EamA family transporter RarD [Elainellaceae cyanobacterium]
MKHISSAQPSPPADTNSAHTATTAGALYAVLAYSSWGLLPIYWKFFGKTPAVEVLSHRIIWSMLFLAGLLLLQHRGAELGQLRHSPKHLRILLATAILLSFNWGLYIYGVNTDRVIETSLGYFINPLVNVLLGFVFLKERLNRAQTIAVGLASLGVAYFVWQFGQIPWIALALALSFGLYGLLRKVVPVSPMVGLTVETLLVTPIALIFVGVLAATGVGQLGVDWRITGLFVGAGVMTSFPLLWFNNAAKRLRLSTLGFFQYLAPTLQLLLGVFLYHEPFTPTHLITFGLIWLALLIYSVTSLLHQRSKRTAS